MPLPKGRPDPSADGAARPEPTPPSIADAVERVFERFDADASGTITLAEVLAVVDPDGTRTEAATKATESFASIDADASGAASQAEVTALLTRLDTDGDGTLERSDRSADGADTTAFDVASVLLMGRHRGGGGPGPERTVDAVVDALFARYDDDASTTIALTELLAVLDPKGTRSELAATVKELFAAVDTSGDAALSEAEVSAAVAQLDTDGDGTIERGEGPGSDAGDAVELIGILLHGAHDHGGSFGPAG